MMNVSEEADRLFAKRSSPAEVDAIFSSLLALEKVVEGSPQETGDRWKESLGRELANVVGHLQQHCESAALPGGVLADAEVALGHSNEVETLAAEHHTLLREAANLLGTLEGKQAGGSEEIRSRALALMRDLKRHQQRAAELLRETLQRDIGGRG